VICRWPAAPVALALAALLAAGPAVGAAFRWAGEADAVSLDPYTRDESMQLSFTGNIYEPLVRHTPDLAIEPALATAWEQVEPTRWRFHLRPGVQWQDGSPFTADDVIFSLHRVQTPESLMRAAVSRVVGATRVDDLTVDLETASPDPILPRELTAWYILPRRWAEQHGAERPALLAEGAENYATRHALGTGPFRVVLREPDRRTVLARNPLWWDHPADLVPEVEFVVLSHAATRVAALISGEVDFITGLPPQDVDLVARTPGLRVMERPELRTIFLGMDQWRERLQGSDLPANPFRDARVREAVARAIDEPAIAAKVMRGHARPAWLLWAPGVNGYDPALDHRPPPDPARARALLAEAGYPNGFSVRLDCPNDRYVMDEAICTAIVAMLARVGIRVQLRAQPKARFFAQIGPPNFDTSFYLLGWTPNTYDALNVLWNLAGQRIGARGLINFGGFADPRLDALVDRIAAEADPAARQQELAAAGELLEKDWAYIPLHQQMLLWAAKDSVLLPEPADGFVALRLLRRK
jgi:peptide/nickel transport system substrate-binding protein